MKDITSATKITFDLAKADIFMNYSKVDIGFATENVMKDQLKGKQGSDRQHLHFCLACRNLLKLLWKSFVIKLLCSMR